MKNLTTIGLPSKGRLKEGSIEFLEKNNLKLMSKLFFKRRLNRVS